MFISIRRYTSRTGTGADRTKYVVNVNSEVDLCLSKAHHRQCSPVIQHEGIPFFYADYEEINAYDSQILAEVIDVLLLKQCHCFQLKPAIINLKIKKN